MATLDNNTTIQNTHFEEFIQFLSKAEVEYEYDDFTFSFFNGVEDEVVDAHKCDVKMNSMFLPVYSEHVKTLHYKLIEEILFNIEFSFSAYLQAFKYLNDIKNKLFSLKENFSNIYKRHNIVNKTTNPNYLEFWIFRHPYDKIETFDNYALEYLNLTNDFIIQCFDTIKNHTFKNQTSSIKNQTTNSLVANSFKYKDLDETPDKINDFYDCLCFHGFIVKEETKLPVFKRVFSDKEITQKVIWYKGVQSLRYLLLKLKEKDLIEDPDNSQLSLVKKCFSYYDKRKKIISDDFSKFNNLKYPTNSKTLQYLDSAIAHLI